MSEAKDDNDRTAMFFQLRPETAAFIDKAAEAAGLPRAKFAREAVVKAAEKALGKDRPTVKDFGTGGRTSPLSEAAKAAGMTTNAYARKLALESLGVDQPVRKSKPRKSSKK